MNTIAEEIPIHPDYPNAVPFRMLGRRIHWRRRNFQFDDGSWSYNDLPGKPGDRKFHIRYHGLEYAQKAHPIPTKPIWRPVTDQEHFIDNLVRKAKERSRRSGRRFDIDSRWVIEQCAKQGWCCALTGVNFQFETDHRRWCLYAPSMDRMDPNMGYTKDNVRIVLLGLNIALNDFGLEFFDKLAAARLAWKAGNQGNG
jgi:hypothetical protein